MTVGAGLNFRPQGLSCMRGGAGDGAGGTGQLANAANWLGQGAFNEAVSAALLGSKVATTNAVWSDSLWTAGFPFATVSAELSTGGGAITLRIPYNKLYQDPNITSAQAVFVYEADGAYYPTFLAMLLDAKIGTQRMWDDTKGSIPQGWQRADGSNGTDSMGTGNFLKTASSASGTTAAASNTGSADLSGQQTNSATTGITVDSHAHGLDTVCEVSSGSDNLWAFTSQIVDTDSAQPSVTDNGHQHNLPDLSHTHPGGSPASATCIVIQRVINT